uniref:NADH-ubiquinone oxidoreductase chain 4L n=1 Tax=Bokermannohyla alvarengai TaxID=1513809 RepID=A0A343RF66_BOKAL|nr:NADH dehydrogenase subunit 4L [Bokermannohyla alvarengai]ATY40983.1 NADH dehydrogenase subunit 4L [Bokermannohyla alvarengai]
MLSLSQEPWLFAATFFLSLLGLSFNRTNMLSALLCLESMMLSLFLGLGLTAVKFSLVTPMMFPVFMLTMSACEAALGLALMVATARSHGTNHLSALNLLQC